MAKFSDAGKIEILLSLLSSTGAKFSVEGVTDAEYSDTLMIPHKLLRYVGVSVDNQLTRETIEISRQSWNIK